MPHADRTPRKILGMQTLLPKNSKWDFHFEKELRCLSLKSQAYVSSRKRREEPVTACNICYIIVSNVSVHCQHQVTILLHSGKRPSGQFNSSRSGNRRSNGEKNTRNLVKNVPRRRRDVVETIMETGCENPEVKHSDNFDAVYNQCLIRREKRTSVINE